MNYRTFLALFLSALALIALSGCNLTAYPAYVLFGQTEKTVKAEYTNLKDKTTVIVVAPEPSIEVVFPQASYNIGIATAHLISKNVKKTRFADYGQVSSWQLTDANWNTVSMSDIGRKFKADRVLYIELYQFDMYEPGSIQLMRGQIGGALAVYEMECPTPNTPSYKSSIEILYPEGAPVAASDTALVSISQKSTILFADKVAKKFYTHKEPWNPQMENRKTNSGNALY